MNLLRSNKGSSLIIFTITITIVLGIAALTLDIGDVVIEKAKLSNAVDAATIAGAQELVTDKFNAANVVDEYMDTNVSDYINLKKVIDSDDRGIEVSSEKNVKYFFANVLGFNNKNVKATAKARVENISSLKGIRPIAVVQQTFTYGKLYTLKEGGGGGSTGNYAPIDLGGTGARVYGDNLLNGYSGTINVGDIILTETGNIAGATQTSINSIIGQCADTYDNYSLNCPRVLFLPVVNTLSVNGKKAIQVLGFATFFLEGFSNDVNGQVDVIGRFITYCMDGKTSSTISDFGTYGIRLVK
ncbi:MAG: Tad domain-containing protein [Bacillota bacterium]|nr:Tad domain-containing protein [Bacillota bacterium]